MAEGEAFGRRLVAGGHDLTMLGLLPVSLEGWGRGGGAALGLTQERGREKVQLSFRG